MDPNRVSESSRTDDPTTRQPARCTGGPSPRGGGLARGLVAVAVVLATAGCTESEFGFSSSTKTARLSVDFEVPGTTSSSVQGNAVSTDVTVSDDPALTIDSVKIALRELQVGRQGAECLFGDVGSGGDGGDGTDCVEAVIETIVQTLPVDDGSQTLLEQGFVEPGTFDRMAFRFNVLEPTDPEAGQLISDHGEMENESVFIGGTFQGERFELLVDIDEEVVVSADEPLTLADEEGGRAVLIWNVAQWLVDPDDGGIEDPAQVGGDPELEQQVEDRIVNTLEVRLD